MNREKLDREETNRCLEYQEKILLLIGDLIKEDIMATINAIFAINTLAQRLEAIVKHVIDKEDKEKAH